VLAAERVKAFSSIVRAALLKLDRLQAPAKIGDLAALPGNRFENLKGDRKGQCSIGVNDQRPGDPVGHSQHKRHFRCVLLGALYRLAIRTQLPMLPLFLV
jgi:RelE-like toxin of type II toxin-antitoxin system HigB